MVRTTTTTSTTTSINNNNTSIMRPRSRAHCRSLS